MKCDTNHLPERRQGSQTELCNHEFAVNSTPDFFAPSGDRIANCRPGAATLSDGGEDKNAQLQSTANRIYQEEVGDKQTAGEGMSYLTSCPASGSGERRVHRWLLSMANRALREGVEFRRWAADMVSHATRPVSATELREAWEKASGSGAGDLAVRRPEPKPAPLTATEYILRGGSATAEDFLEASPVRIVRSAENWLQAVLLLRALFRPDEYVFCGWNKNTPGELGKTVRTRVEWEAEFQQRGAAGQPIPPLFIPNPVSPVPAMSKEGKPSLRCDASVVAYRHAVAEMDRLDLLQQFQFWWGWGLEAVAAVTFSGNHSLHVLLRVDATDPDEWECLVRRGLFDQVLIPLGCDGQCKNASRLSRLAGAVRNDEKVCGGLQSLLYVQKELT